MPTFARILVFAVYVTSALPVLSAAADGPPPPMSAAARKRVDAEMRKLEASTRVEQRCNARAMGIVRREHWPMNPDEGSVGAFAEPEVDGAAMRASGAAVRSRGNWYHIAYDCVTTDDGLDIKSFSYSLGDVVPKSDWKAHFLVAP